jgi:hypothetical protein
METLGTIIGGIGSLLMLVCHIIVIVKMFQKGQTGLAIVAIVLTLCGFGFLLTLIYGWMRSTEWNIKNIMMAYTLGWILWITGSVLNPGQYTYLQGQLQKG